MKSGCVWYLVTPDESESTNQNQFDNFDGIDSRGGIQDAHGVDPNLGLVDPDADVVVALPIQDDPDAEDSRQEPDFGIGEQVTFAFTKTIPQGLCSEFQLFLPVFVFEICKADFISNHKYHKRGKRGKLNN